MGPRRDALRNDDWQDTVPLVRDERFDFEDQRWSLQGESPGASDGRVRSLSRPVPLDGREQQNSR